MQSLFSFQFALRLPIFTAEVLKLADPTAYHPQTKTELHLSALTEKIISLFLSL
jgi:hypothetical protein